MVNTSVLDLDVEEEAPLKGGSEGRVLEFEPDTDTGTQITRDKAKQLYADTVARTAVRCGVLIITWYVACPTCYCCTVQRCHSAAACTGRLLVTMQNPMNPP